MTGIDAWVLVLAAAVLLTLLVMGLALRRTRRARWDPTFGGRLVPIARAPQRAPHSRITVISQLGRAERRPLRRAASPSHAAQEEVWPPQQQAPAPSPAAPSLIVNPDGLTVLQRIIALGQDLQLELAGAGVDLEIPLGPVADVTGRLVDCDLPEPELRFLYEERGWMWERTLDQGRDLDLGVRLGLAIGIGRFLHQLHERGWAYGAMSWPNLLLSSEPRPDVLIRGLPHLRRLGGSQAFIVSPDPLWKSAGSPDEPTLDLDRYQFALLLYRLTLTSSASAPLPSAVGLEGSELGSLTHAGRLEVLFHRAAGAPGTRPAISEWLAALSAPPFPAAPHGVQRIRPLTEPGRAAI